MHQDAIEIEQDRGVDPTQLLFTDAEISIADHHKAIGLRLVQRPAQQQPQIGAAPLHGQGIPSEKRQHAKGIPMAFQPQVQIRIGVEGHRAGHGDGFLALASLQGQVQADQLTLNDNRSLLQLQGLARQAGGVEQQIGNQQGSRSAEVVAAADANTAAELRRHRSQQRQQRERNLQQGEVTGSTEQRAAKRGDHRFKLECLGLVIPFNPKVGLGDQIGLQALWIRTVDRSRQIDPPLQTLQLRALAGVSQGIGLKRPARCRQSLQLTIKRPTKGVDEQGSEILGTAGGQARFGIAPSQLTGQKRQPGHIQAFGLDAAVHPATQIATGLQPNAALQWRQCCIGLKTAIPEGTLQLEALHGNSRHRAVRNDGRPTDREGAHGKAPCTRELTCHRFGLVDRRHDETKSIDVEVRCTPAVAALLSSRSQPVQAQLPLTPAQEHGLGPSIGIEFSHERAGHDRLLGRHRQTSTTAQFTVEAALPAFGNLQGTNAGLIQRQADVGLKPRQRTLHATPRRHLPAQRRTDQGGETAQAERLEFKAALKLTGLQPPLRQLHRKARFRPQQRTGEVIQHQGGVLRGPSGLKRPLVQQRVGRLAKLQAQLR